MNCLGLANFITRNKDLLLRKAVLIALIAVTEKRPIPDNVIISPTDEEDTYIANINLVNKKNIDDIVLIDKDNNVYCISVNLTDQTSNQTKLYKVHNQPDTPILDIYDKFNLTKGMIENYQSDIPLLTTYGRFILNYTLLAKPLGNIIPYKNDIFNPKKLGKEVAKGILDKKINREMYENFVNNIFFIGNITEITVPDMSKKSMVTSKEVLAKRDELYTKYKDQLNDPIIVAKIEDELIALDKQYLADDPSSTWILVSGDWDVARKKMYITNGIMESFSNDSNSFTFIKEALDEKLDYTKFPAMANDIRRGSYMRGKETAKGGEETKFVLRIFQNVAITEDDCGTKEGIPITLNFSDLNNYEGRHAFLNGKEFVINKQTIGNIIDKPIILRSPMHCHAKNGYCYACYGDIYKQLELKSVGMKVVEASSALMQTAMKAMHKSKVNTIQLDDLNQFVI